MVEPSIAATRKPLRAVLFDFDDTLALPEMGIVAGVQEVLRSVGFAPPSPEVIIPVLRLPMHEAFAKLAPSLEPEHLIQRFRQLEAAGHIGVRLDEAVETLTRALHEAGCALRPPDVVSVADE